ncbi:MAG TPA: hypothetical protein VG127_03065 [Rubrobacteraceae bacterium]|nr:hypothetical protein [Rubrobacteraceae bacterium]
MVEISLVASFLGGVLSLLSPCSAMLLPAFFAYAFGEELVKKTGVFYLGLGRRSCLSGWASLRSAPSSTGTGAP